MPDAEPLRRFFIDPSDPHDETVTLTGDIAHRLARVLRYKPGDRLILATGVPTESVIEIATVSPKAITANVIGRQPAPLEPSVEVIVYQALIRPNRFDYALEKGTEVGVSRFVPVMNARSQGQTEDAAASRTERWQRLITEASEQCGRGRLPEVTQPMPFAEAIQTAPGLRIVPWEDEREQKLSDYLRSLPETPPTISLFIGPEGGYTRDEIDLARDCGATLVTLGRQILRSETASAIAAAITLHELG